MTTRYSRREKVTIEQAYERICEVCCQADPDAADFLTQALALERHPCSTTAKARLVTTFAAAFVGAYDEPLATLADLRPGERLAALAAALVASSGLNVTDALCAAARASEAHGDALDRRVLAAGCLKVVQLFPAGVMA